MSHQSNSPISKKIKIIKDEINPFIENNDKYETILNIKSSCKSKTKYDLSHLFDRVSLNFDIEDSLDEDHPKDTQLDCALNKFKSDFREILEDSSKVLLIETPKKKPILIILFKNINLNLEDKCIFFAGENKDLEDYLDILFLIGYSKLEITKKRH